MIWQFHKLILERPLYCEVKDIRLLYYTDVVILDDLFGIRYHNITLIRRTRLYLPAYGLQKI